MHIEPYRRVLALPGVRSLMLVAMLARVPVVASGIVLTLHVVLDQHRGYAAAGVVGAAVTVGAALGAPLLGRLVDRSGLRRMLVLSVAAEIVFWLAAPLLPYPALLVAGFVSGLLALPVFSVVRQSIAALVPEASRRQAYALDSMGAELSFMVGPALAVLVVTQVSARAAMWAVGVGMVLSGLALYLLDPPTRAADEHDAGPAPARRTWLRPRLLAVLVVATATTVVLSGTDVGMVAVLRRSGDLDWTGVVLIAWGLYSMVGGFVFGGLRRPLPPVLLIALLGLFTVPIGLAHGWGWLCLTLLPAGALCAPTLAATADAVSRLVPAAARGEAMGWYGSALTVGLALGAPAVGAVVDHAGTAAAFAAAGLAGLLVAAGALAVDRRAARHGSVAAAGPAEAAAGEGLPSGDAPGGQAAAATPATTAAPPARPVRVAAAGD
jgi:predicted MFS family arabinose efflux permease